MTWSELRPWLGVWAIFVTAGVLYAALDPVVPLWYGVFAGTILCLMMIGIGWLGSLGGDRRRKRP